jgi:hypothetical protein
MFSCSWELGQTWFDHYHSSTWQPLQYCCELATQAPHVLPAWQPNLMPSHVYIMWLSPSHSWWSLSTALVTTCGNPIPIFHKTYSKSSRESGCILALERIMMIQLFKLAYSYFSIWLANFSKLLWPFATADAKINSATTNWASVTNPTMLSLPYKATTIRWYYSVTTTPCAAKTTGPSIPVVLLPTWH